MPSIKKQNLNPKLDAYEQDIEDNLDISQLLSPQEKAHELAKLKLAAKEYLPKKETRQRYTLPQLLQHITSKDITALNAETAWAREGKPKGREII
jgi:hypothetical protein